MHTYVGLIKLSSEAREHLSDAPSYLEKVKEIIEGEGGMLENVYAIMGPWDFLAITTYPENEAAFRVLAKIGALENVTTETFPAERVEVFLEALT